MTEVRPSRRLLNQLTAAMISWVDCQDPDRVLDVIRRWDEGVWQAAKLVALMQGIGPLLCRDLPATPIYAGLSPDFRRWLDDEYRCNAARVTRFLEDLAAILHACGRAGLTIMPLKGSVLLTQYYPVPAVRPMADLDFLVPAGELPALAAVLQKLEYKRKPSLSPHETVHTFVNPGGGTVTSYTVDHPDNPRPVEVHTELAKAMWLGRGGYDLTTYIWSGSREDEILGERVQVALPERFLTYLATHAMFHHMRATARFVHLLDLARVAPAIEKLDLENIAWAYPALRLAARALPARMKDLDLLALQRLVPVRLQHWADKVPLDARCGLNVNPKPAGRRDLWSMRWQLWHPSLPRLTLAYPDLPLVVAFGRHGLAVLQRLAVRARSDRLPVF